MEVPLQDLSLDCVDKNKLAWVSEGSSWGSYSIRHYSDCADKVRGNFFPDVQIKLIAPCLVSLMGLRLPCNGTFVVQGVLAQN